VHGARPRPFARPRARLAGFGNVRVVTADARRRGLVPPFTYRQLRRLARELGFGLDARPADLDAVQWAGLYAFLARPPHLGRRAQSP
jgi:hypothetical protein